MSAEVIEALLERDDARASELLDARAPLT